jgi:hypothetical protein
MMLIPFDGTGQNYTSYACLYELAGIAALKL